MATKTFKIGEYCQGGIITVETTSKQVTIIGKEWDHSKGTRASSDQSNAKEFTRETVAISDEHAKRKIEMFLNNLTTSYYSDQVLKWIESKVQLPKSLFW